MSQKLLLSFEQVIQAITNHAGTFAVPPVKGNTQADVKLFFAIAPTEKGQQVTLTGAEVEFYK